MSDSSEEDCEEEVFLASSDESSEEEDDDEDKVGRGTCFRGVGFRDASFRFPVYMRMSVLLLFLCDDWRGRGWLEYWIVEEKEVLVKCGVGENFSSWL